ncbi:MAG: hypothetical protein CVV56_09170 [Tenericutes bacterium HGW-Tenericutes-1]|jgi:hypothetical protein|nr:MAG: hypothetical protein CVV56_09170 [Tenericutes bacterium HGW-Tenericutes-1]
MKPLLSYQDSMHRQGRIFTVLGLSVMISIPILIMLFTGVTPNIHQMVIGIGVLSLIYLPGGIVEVATYSPILGTTATYLAFITGNLANLKIPCVMNARQIVGTQVGTEENEVVSTVSVVASTLTTVTIMTIGIIMLIPLRPILSSEVLQPAFNWVVSALFGALGYKYFKGNLKIVAIPLLLMVVLAFLLPGFVIGNITIVIMVGAVTSVLVAKLLYDKKLI